MGDTGTITAGGMTFEVADTIYPVADLIVHRGRVTAGTVKAGDSVSTEINVERRAEIQRHHTATHLLHEALARVLGKHVRQAGSIVTPTFLRFDFNHFAPVTLDELREQGFKAFYVAIGCQGGRLAGIPGEDAEDVTVAVDFLREVNSGKIDALPGRTIVVGGGNVAIDVARNACRLGSEHVEMFCLESEAQMPASEEERREAVEDGAHISCGWGPKEVHLDEDGRVCGITFKRCTRVFDDEGRFAPEYDESDLRRVDADRVVMSIGQSIVWGDLLAGSKVELGHGQGALADPQTYQTAEPDIFVGGDVYTGPSFAIDAIAAGHEAAVSIHRFVQPGSTLTIGRNQRRYTALDRDDVVIESYDNASREVAHVDRDREKAAPFSEYVETFTEEQVRAETARCLGCGASIVDPNKCIGCGLCTTKCAFDAIHLDRDRSECSTMVKYEQKLPSLGKYALKRAIKIKFGRK